MQQPQSQTFSPVTIVTHNGKFHADEVSSVAMLMYLYDDYCNIIRTRDENTIQNADIVVDVGGVYDSETHRFDHHQDEFQLQEQGVPLSSLGLVFRKFGSEFVKKLLRKHKLQFPDNVIHVLQQSLYLQYVQEIDAIDNGMYPKMNGLPKLRTNVSNIVSKMNHYDPFDDEKQYHCFMRAVKYTLDIMKVTLTHQFPIYKHFSADMKCMSEYYHNRHQVHPSGQILIMLDNHRAWKLCLQELDQKKELRFLIYPQPDGKWKLSTTNQIGSRSLIPIASSRQIEKEPFVHDIIFLHKNQFLSVCRNQATAVALATFSIQVHQKTRS